MTLSAHMAAATARWLELAWEFHESVDSDDYVGYLAWRFGISRREAREYMRVAEALQELPATRAAFSRGELTFTKVRALTRVATAASEEGLIGLAGALTASRLERALRVYRRIAVEDARETHEVEFVDSFFEEDGSLYLRARLAAEDGSGSSRRWRLRGSGWSRGGARGAGGGREHRELRRYTVRCAPRRTLAPCAWRRCSSLPKCHPIVPSSGMTGRGLSSMSTLPRCRRTVAAARSSRTAR